MKTNKMRLPVIILAVTIFVMAAYVLVSCIAMKPTVTEQDFAFSITYELDGETKVISEVYSVRYVGNSGYSDTKERVYYGEIVGVQESRMLVIKENADGSSICIDTQLFDVENAPKPDQPATDSAEAGESAFGKLVADGKLMVVTDKEPTEAELADLDAQLELLAETERLSLQNIL